MLAHYSHCLYLVLFATGEGRGKTSKRKTAKAIVSLFFSSSQGSHGSHVWLAGSLARTLATLVPYRIPKWKTAIKFKRKYAKQNANSRTNEKWELKRKYRDIATKYKRHAVQKYWQRKQKTFKLILQDFIKPLDLCGRLQGASTLELMATSKRTRKRLLFHHARPD